MPALPLDSAGKYVAGAYLVFFALILAYVAIMAVRLGRMERALVELNELAERQQRARDGADADVEARPAAISQASAGERVSS